MANNVSPSSEAVDPESKYLEQLEEGLQLMKGYALVGKGLAQASEWAEFFYKPRGKDDVLPGEKLRPGSKQGYGLVVRHDTQTVQIQPIEWPTGPDSSHPQELFVKVQEPDVYRVLSVLDLSQYHEMRMYEYRRIMDIATKLFGGPTNGLDDQRKLPKLSGRDIAYYMLQHMTTRSPFYRVFNQNIGPEDQYSMRDILKKIAEQR